MADACNIAGPRGYRCELPKGHPRSPNGVHRHEAFVRRDDKETQGRKIIWATLDEEGDAIMHRTMLARTLKYIMRDM